MFGIPVNVFPLAAMGLVAFFFGVRGFLHYRNVKSPLTLYYAWSGVLFGLSGMFYAIPFGLSSSEVVLKTAVTIADLLFYAGLMVQMRIIWYLGLKRKVSFGWFFWPTIILICISLGFDMVKRVQSRFYVENGLAVFPTTRVTLYLLALMSISIIIVGVLTLMQVRDLKQKHQKIRLITLGLMFLLAGLTVEYNFLFLGGENTSPAIVLGYAIAAIGFVIGLFFIRRKKM